MQDKKKLIILGIGKQNFVRAQKFKKRLLKDKKEILIITDCCIEDMGLQGIRTIKYYQDFFNLVSYPEDLNNCHKFMNSVEEALVNKQLTFNDLVTYQGVSLWRMSSRYLLKELVPFLKDLRLSLDIINFELPQEMIILNNPGRLGNIFREICLHKGIITNPASRIGNFNKLYKKSLLNAYYFSKNILRFCKSVYYKWLNFYYARNKKYNIDQVVIFFIYLARYFDSLLPLINKYKPNERLVINMPFSDCKKRLKNENIEFQEFYGYSIYNIFDRRVNKFLNNVWSVINQSRSFQSALNFNGFNSWPILKEVFWFLIFKIFPYQIRNVGITQKIISSFKTRSIVVSDYSCEVVLPAKSLSVPTIAVMASSLEEFDYFGKIISDYIIVWGNYWKESLLKLGMKPEQVFVVGPPKFDSIINTKFQRSDIFREFGLTEKLKTVVYIGSYSSQWFGYADFLEQLHMVFKGLRNTKNVNLVTKVHPSAPNLKIYEKIARSEGCKNMRIIGDCNVWKLIDICDLVISDFSTLAYEALIMDKIVILFCNAYKNFNKDLWNFKETGAAIFINSFSELEAAIKDTLENYEIQSTLRENRKRYIMEHAWPLDGKAADRMKDLIEQISQDNYFKGDIYSKKTNEDLKNKEKAYA